MSYSYENYLTSDCVNAKNYGVKGDGITDDTNAINSVLTSHRSVYFPNGTYIFKGTINVPNNTKIVGNGNSTIFKLGYPYNLTIYPWRPSEAGHYTNRPYFYINSNCVLSNFCIRGDKTEAVDQMHVGVLIHGSNNLCVNIQTFDINYFPDSVQDITHPFGPIEFCPAFGFFVFGGDNNTLYNCKASNNGYQGIGVENAKYTTLGNCFIGNSFRCGIQIHRGAKGVIIDSCTIKNVDTFKTSDILFHGASGEQYAENIIINNCLTDGLITTERLINSIASIWGYERNIKITNCILNSSGIGIILATAIQEAVSPTEYVTIENNIIHATKRGIGVDGNKCIVTGNIIEYGTTDIIITGEDKVISNNLSFHI